MVTRKLSRNSRLIRTQLRKPVINQPAVFKYPSRQVQAYGDPIHSSLKNQTDGKNLRSQQLYEKG